MLRNATMNPNPNYLIEALRVLTENQSRVLSQHMEEKLAEIKTNLQIPVELTCIYAEVIRSGCMLPTAQECKKKLRAEEVTAKAAGKGTQRQRLCRLYQRGVDEYERRTGQHMPVIAVPDIPHVPVRTGKTETPSKN